MESQINLRSYGCLSRHQSRTVLKANKKIYKKPSILMIPKIIHIGPQM